MRLLLTADTIGGIWQYSLELARGLAAHGVRVQLAAMGGAPSPSQRAEAAAIPTLSLAHAPYRLEWMQDAAADVAAAGEWLLELEAAFAPDVVQVNGFAHAALPWRAPVVLAAHSCVSTWWRAVHGTAAPAAEWAAYRAGVERGLAAAACVVTPTAALLAAMAHEYGPIARARVIANGCALPAAPGGPREPVILVAGRAWDRAKNLAVLRAAAERVRWPVQLAGALTGPDGERFDPGCMHALGTLAPADLQARMARASIYVSPALYEPFGLGVLEAAGAGCALVLADSPTFRELWQDAALFVPPRDAAALAAALESLAAAAPERARLGAAARARAASYSRSRMADAYVALYGQVRQSPAARAVACA